MGLSVEIPGIPSSVQIQNIGVWRQIGEVARAQFTCDFAKVASLPHPDPASLRGQTMAVWGSPTVAVLPGSGAAIFRGTIVAAEVGYWPPDRLELRVLAVEGPLGALPAHQLDGVWLSFAKDAELKIVTKTLLEQCKFGKDLEFKSAISDKLPSDLLCAGQSPWLFLHHLLRAHAAALAIRLDKEGKPTFALVRQAKDLEKIGHERRYGLGAQQKQVGARTISHIAFSRSVVPPEAGLCWWDAAKEQAGIAGPKARVAPAPLWSSESLAIALQPWQKVRDRAQDVAISLSTDDPEISLGDRIVVAGGVDTASLGWLSSYLDAEPLFVTGVDIQMTGGSQRVSTTVEAMPASAAAVKWAQTTPLSEPLVQVLTGEVKEIPADQGQMKVALDVEAPEGCKRPVIHCEWMSPCYSGAGGALHMPPLAGDKVRIAVENCPYGRVVYLGAVPGDQRLATFRKSISGYYEAARPASAHGSESSPISLPGNHLARAIGASPKNLSVWVSPGAGIEAKEPEEKAARWSVIASETNQIVEMVRPTLHLKHSSGQGVRVEHKMEGHQLIQSTAGIELNAKTDLQMSSENTKIRTRKDFTVIASQKASIQGDNEAALTSKKVSIKGTASSEIEGGTVSIKGTGVVDVQGKPIKLNC